MPPTKHMTGDVFRGYLLDGFFNLVGAMTGQGILLVGMMTEAVVTPFLSDRDLALQNVRYVLNAAGGLDRGLPPAARRLHPDPGPRRCWARRSTCSTRIVDEPGRAPLLEAIADGTFGLMKRPADAGKGLDGVVRRAPTATTTRRSTCSRRGHPMTAHARRPDIVRPYGDTTGDGMVQVSFTLPVPHDKRAEGAALQLAAKMGLDPALLVHAKAMGPDFTFFVVYGSANHLVDLREVEVVEREYPLLTPKEVNKAIKSRLRRKLVVVGACIGTDAHTVGHRRDPQHQGLRGGEGPGVLPRDQGGQPRRPGAGARARRPAPGRSAPTPSWSPRWSPSGTPTSTTRPR